MGANPHAYSQSKAAVYTSGCKIGGMSFKKSFRALPVQLGPYQNARQRRRRRTAAMKVLIAAAVGGLAAGTLGAVNESGGAVSIASTGRGIAVSLGLARKNTPMPGAHYSPVAMTRAQRALCLSTSANLATAPIWTATVMGSRASRIGAEKSA